MGRKVGRNDPCWCGSGKKLKKCHGYAVKTPSSPPLVVQPARFPTPITTHSVFRAGRWVSEPGLIAMNVYASRPEDIDSELRNLRSGWAEALSIEQSRQNLASRFNDIQHKLQGVRYHRDNYAKHEDAAVAQFRDNHTPPAGARLIDEDPGLTFEIEGFLYQVKSTLDMLAHLLGDLGFRSVGHTFGDKGDDVIKALRHFPASCTAEGESLRKLIVGAQESWLDEAVATRDRIAHRGGLDDLTCFVQEPHVGGATAVVHYPQMPNGEKARLYLEGVERSLRVFVNDFVRVALTAGKRTASPQRPVSPD